MMLLTLLCFLTGCGVYSNIGNITYEKYEGIVQSDTMYTEYEYTKYNKVTYYFNRKEYSDSKRKEVISQIEKVADILPEDFSIYFGSELYKQGVYGKAFYDTSFEYNLENIVVLLQAIYGECSNYGLVYGYANYLLDEMSLETNDLYIDEEMIQFCNSLESQELSRILDLNMPLFEIVYAEEETINMSKTIACSMVEYIIAEWGVEKIDELLKQSYLLDTKYDEAFCYYANKWLESEIGTSYRKVPNAQAIRFEKNCVAEKEDYPYIVHTVSVKAYVHKDMQVLWYESDTTGWEAFDYGKIIQYFTFLENDIAIAKEYLSPWLDLETSKMEMKIFMPREETNTYISQYDSRNDTAMIVLLSSGYHEYIHHLVSKYNPERWMSEGIAVYMDIYQMEKKSSDISQTAQWVYHADEYEKIPVGVENKDEFLLAIEAYRNLSNAKDVNKYDLEAYYERAAYMECIGYEGWGNAGENVDIRMTYEKAGSLFNYLIQNYGEEAVFKIYEEYSALEKEINMTYAELLKSWEEDLITRAEEDE